MSGAFNSLGDGVTAALLGTKFERNALLDILSGLPLGEYFEGPDREKFVRLIHE